jgi:hypothetical protein
MPLNYVQLSANIDNHYESLKLDKRQDNPKQVPYPIDTLEKLVPLYPLYPPYPIVPIEPQIILDPWMKNYVISYDDDANNAIPTAPSVDIISLPELLIFTNSATCGGPDMMAAKISEYWQAQLTFGAPVYNGIISIVNDAAKIKPIIETYMCTLGTYTAASEPHYEHLFQFIENQVKTIIWTVTEVVGSGTTSYQVTVT